MLRWLATLYSCTCNYQGGKTGDSNICTMGWEFVLLLHPFPWLHAQRKYLHVSVL